jgi:hypothetical protein
MASWKKAEGNFPASLERRNIFRVKSLETVVKTVQINEE